jgi:anti-anti-sigma factor
MELTITEQSETLTRVALIGRLDTMGVERVETQFNAAITPRGKNAVLDLSGVSFLSSMGIRMLLTAARTLARRGARLVLQAPQPLVLESIRHAALEDLIPIASDQAAAVALLQQQ